MSDSENKKVQDILRDIAKEDGLGLDVVANRLGISLSDVNNYNTAWRRVLIKLANRIDMQSVVEVLKPEKDPFVVLSEKNYVGKGVSPKDIKDILDFCIDHQEYYRFERRDFDRTNEPITKDQAIRILICLGKIYETIMPLIGNLTRSQEEKLSEHWHDAYQIILDE